MGRTAKTGRRSAAERVQRQMDSLIAQKGPWTAHDLTLAPGVQTLCAEVPDSRLRRIVQLAADSAAKPLDELRVLDLGCLEGQFGIEFALHGAQVVAVEGREANLRKAEFAAEALGVRERIDFRHSDIRDIRLATYGQFDVILCLGLLYHLDTPDVMELASLISDLCTGVAIIDTHFSLEPRAEAEWRGHRYSGAFWAEYAPGRRATEEKRHCGARSATTAPSC